MKAEYNDHNACELSDAELVAEEVKVEAAEVTTCSKRAGAQHDKDGGEARHETETGFHHLGALLFVCCALTQFLDRNPGYE